MRIQESAENYLETILILKKRSGHVRSIDIANELSYSKPSVSVDVYKRQVMESSSWNCASMVLPVVYERQKAEAVNNI